MLRGTGVSEGCGIGKALIIQHRSLDYSGVVFGGAQQEKERLRAAINAFMQKTEQLRDRLQASAGEKEACRRSRSCSVFCINALMAARSRSFSCWAPPKTTPL